MSGTDGFLSVADNLLFWFLREVLKLSSLSSRLVSWFPSQSLQEETGASPWCCWFLDCEGSTPGPDFPLKDICHTRVPA